MSVLIKDMKMPKECGECRWFHFHGETCTTPKYYLDARCELVKSGQDWYGKDVRGGWIGESIEHIPGWAGYYPHKHCVEMGTRASQCPLCELPSAQPEPLTDKEQRIFLAAMGREEKVCAEVDRNYTREPYEDSLMSVCREIIRKVKGALWT